MGLYDNASLIFSSGASAGKEGKVHSLKPGDGSKDLTFSRGSNLTVTRVDSNGLIEKGRENLLHYSNALTSGNWNANNVSVTGGQLGYDGTNNAFLIETTNNYISSSASLYQSRTNYTPRISTYSVYAKAGTTNWLRINATGVNAYFDLSGSGAIGHTSPQQTHLRLIEAKIESVSNGWFRCSLTIWNINNNSISVNFTVTNANSSLNYSQGDNLYLQNAQAEGSLVPTEYIESVGASTGLAGILEDTPRFDHLSGSSCPSLLLEPTSSNLIKYSEFFDGWGKANDATTTTNFGISPEGVQNSTNLILSNEMDYIYTTLLGSGTFKAGVFSIYAKGTGNLIIADSRSEFDNNNAYGSFALTPSWQRIVVNPDSNLIRFKEDILLKTDENGLNAEIYGAQFESKVVDSVERNLIGATSYIPNNTNNNIVTRVTDNGLGNSNETYSLSKKGAIFFETEKTLFNEYHVQDRFQEYLSLNNSSGDEEIGVWGQYVNGYLGIFFRLRFYTDQNLNTYSIKEHNFLLNHNEEGIEYTENPVYTKHLIKWDSFGYKIFIDGVKVLDEKGIVRINNSDLYWFRLYENNLSGLKKIFLFDKNVPDYKCISLTNAPNNFKGTLPKEETTKVSTEVSSQESTSYYYYYGGSGIGISNLDL